MRIALINGSPKAKENASGWLLEYVKAQFGQDAEATTVHFRRAMAPTEEQLAELTQADAWLFAFPLYVDGIPGHLLSVLRMLETAGLANEQRKIYGICNCGFYEGEQNEPALDVLRNWSVKCGYVWSGAVGIGGGGATLSLTGMGKVGEVLMKPVLKALIGFAERIEKGQMKENVYVSIALPRAIYQFCAHDGWKKKIKANGGKVEDLERRL